MQCRSWRPFAAVVPRKNAAEVADGELPFCSPVAFPTPAYELQVDAQTWNGIYISAMTYRLVCCQRKSTKGRDIFQNHRRWIVRTQDRCLQSQQLPIESKGRIPSLLLACRMGLYTPVLKAPFVALARQIGLGMAGRYPSESGLRTTSEGAALPRQASVLAIDRFKGIRV